MSIETVALAIGLLIMWMSRSNEKRRKEASDQRLDSLRLRYQISHTSEARFLERNELKTLRRRRHLDRTEIKRLRGLLKKRETELINLAEAHNREFLAHESYKMRHRTSENNLKAVKAECLRLREETQSNGPSPEKKIWLFLFRVLLPKSLRTGGTK